MNVLIRADASPRIGMGHFMRCLTLAKALKESGARIIFVTQDVVGNKVDELYKNEFDVVLISPVEDDAAQTIQAIRHLGIHCHWIIVDNYELAAPWHDLLRPYTDKIMVIDDIANRPLNCDLLLDQNYYPDMDNRYSACVPFHTVKLLGPKFALLRNDFYRHRTNTKKNANQNKKIVIFFGGGDCSAAILKALDACHDVPQNNLTIDVVVSEACSDKEKISTLCNHASIRYFCQPEGLAELMMQADFAIGAGGVSLWERCCLGLPSIVLSLADNQVEVAQSAASLGVIKYLGKIQQVNTEDLTHSIQDFLANPAALQEMTMRAQKLVDGKGCEKVVKQLYE